MARKSKVPSIAEENQQTFPTFTPSEKEKNLVSNVFQKFRRSADDRNRIFDVFDGLDLNDYIDDSVHRFTTNRDEREDIEDWQARVHDPFTRNKVLAILGKVVQVLPIATFTPRGDEDYRKALIMNDLYQYSEDVDDYEELMSHVLLEAIVKGTVIGYEGFEHKERKVRNIKKYADELKYTEETEVKNNLYGAIVRLDEFYPQHVGFRNIKMQDYCFWRKTMPHQHFLEEYDGYSKSQYVQPYKSGTNSTVSSPAYLDYISPEVSDGEVEVIKYYNQVTDEYVMIANGVWLNPVEVGDDPEVISPMPFNHKQLPFWDIRFDYFTSDFFYGKSLPDRLKSMQDVLNVLTNMLLDQSFLTIFPPLLTNGFDNVEDDYIRPGRRVPIDTQGLPINQAFMKLDLGTPSGWFQYILEYTRKIMEQSSIDQVSAGQAGVGGRTTAQEIRIAAEGVASTLNLFGRAIKYGLKRKAMLRGANILQFWFNENSPYIDMIRGEGATKDAKQAFSTFKRGNVVLSNGKRGTKIIEIYKDKSNLPKKGDLKARSIIAQASTNQETEIVAIDPAYIRSFEADVVIVPNDKNDATRDIDKALQLEKVRIYLSFFPDLVDRQELAMQTAEKLGDDPQKVIKSEVFNPPPPQQGPNGQNGELSQLMSQNPEMNVANNAARSVLGGNNDSTQLRDLQNSMNG